MSIEALPELPTYMGAFDQFLLLLCEFELTVEERLPRSFIGNLELGQDKLRMNDGVTSTLWARIMSVHLFLGGNPVVVAIRIQTPKWCISFVG